MSIAKPELRGMLKARTARHFIVACVFSAACTLGWKFAINDPRKRKYADYYKTYDIDKDYARMKEAGAFQAVGPEGVVKEW